MSNFLSHALFRLLWGNVLQQINNAPKSKENAQIRHNTYISRDGVCPTKKVGIFFPTLIIIGL